MMLRFPTLKEMLKYFVVAGLAIIALGVGVFFYWSASDSDVLKINNAPFPVRTIREHPTADGVVILKADYCKNVDAVGRARVSFYSSSREIFLPISKDKADSGCYNTEVPVLIPRDLPPGEYRIKFRVTYQVNPIKTVVEEFDSRPFEVVAP